MDLVYGIKFSPSELASYLVNNDPKFIDNIIPTGEDVPEALELLLSLLREGSNIDGDINEISDNLVDYFVELWLGVQNGMDKIPFLDTELTIHRANGDFIVGIPIRLEWSEEGKGPVEVPFPRQEFHRLASEAGRFLSNRTALAMLYWNPDD